MNTRQHVKIHQTAEVSADAAIGDGTSIWNWAQVREKATIGRSCIISKGVYVDSGVVIGNCVKIQNHVSIYNGVTVEDNCFIGPHVCFTNDMMPRATRPDGSLRGAEDWKIVNTRVREGASIAANSTILCGIEIGAWALIGAGSVVVKDVPPHALVVGSPAKLIGYVCKCGARLPANVDRCNSCSNCGLQW